MHKLESAIENDWHKILCDFQTWTDYLILATRLDLELIKKKKRTL